MTQDNPHGSVIRLCVANAWSSISPPDYLPPNKAGMAAAEGAFAKARERTYLKGDADQPAGFITREAERS